MNIAMLTTWSSACGIAEYSKNLCTEFFDMGHNLLILNNKEEGEGIVRNKEHPQYVLSKVFGVHWWGENSIFDADKAIYTMNYFENALGPIDVLIIQYQSSLYADSGFNKFLAGVKCPIIVLRHDSSVNSKHKFPDRTINTVHNKNIPHDYYIPFPTIEMTPKVFSFGMGRNDYAFIKMACGEIGVDFESHDSRKNGWLPEDILFEKMNDADAIVLWYNEVGIEGQSAALRTAISSCRPVIVNDVGWFKDAPDCVYIATNKKTLQTIIKEVLNLDYIRENSFKECAKKYLEVINASK